MEYQNSDQNRINDLISRLGNDDGFIREDAALGPISVGKEAIPALTSALKSKSQSIQWEAAKTLGAIADPPPFPI